MKLTPPSTSEIIERRLEYWRKEKKRLAESGYQLAEAMVRELEGILEIVTNDAGDGA